MLSFGPPEEYEVHMDSNIWDNIPQMSDEDNTFLCRPFTEKEIKDALDQMEKRLQVLKNTY
jgi:hypothetical protein